MRKLAFASVTIACVALLGACPPPGGWPKPPFDATGDYEGTWQGQTDPTAEDAESHEILACPLTMSLKQELTAPYPGDHRVTGTVVVDYSCLNDLLPDSIQELPDSTVDVSGLLGDDGKIVLLSGGCGVGACAVMTLAGSGEDANDDGIMDSFSGNWSFIILIAGVQPFGVSGTFTVDAIEPEAR